MELDEESVSSILEHTANDGKTYQTKYYSLDAIISIGYRVNSKKATQFRQWATRVLKEFAIKGFVIDEKSMRKIGNSDFSTKPTNFYNLDVIISVGYRVKSLQGTRFRQWATRHQK